MKTMRVTLQRDGRTTDDLVAVEEPLEIRLAERRDGLRLVKPLSITMRTPGEDVSLAAGFLLTEGILHHPDQITGINAVPTRGFVDVELADGVAVAWDRLERHFYTASSCGVCGKASIDLVRTRLPAPPEAAVRYAPHSLQSWPAAARQAQDAFEMTGGLHAAALFDPGGRLLALAEDVGRHNAADKVIGSRWLQRLPLGACGLFLSGRASFELVQKAAMARIPVVAAVGAPSSLAIELAEQAHVTLVGFLREDGMNVYAGAERLTG